MLMIGFSMQHGLAEPVDKTKNPPLTVVQMEEQAMAPRVYTVIAYVIHKDDVCPPCPPHAVCETCQLGIRIADSMDAKGLYLPTPKAAEFQMGREYIFLIRYQIVRNAAGAWQMEGPQLLEHAPADSDATGEGAP
ncbi:MAG TPA: hypothetical protein VKA31_11605 [Mariprofundaceae bacterium]|nr:hypothetical protein [Mariprofundaceae bacterium]